MANSNELREKRSDERDDERQDVIAEAELSDRELEEAAGGRIPCYPESTSIPPAKDVFEPLSPGV